ncbi:hypothetical protein GCM10010441_03860 [Kitasatospora paracochleata]
MAGMIDREYAARAAQEDLDRRYAGRIVVAGVEAHELVWIVFYQSAPDPQTGRPGPRLGGNGPYLVDRLDGGLHRVSPTSYVSGLWEADYRRRVRKLPVPEPVEELHPSLTVHTVRPA